MAKINIHTTKDEQDLVLIALGGFKDKVVSTYTISKLVGLSPSKVRYVIMDLEEAGKVRRIPVKAFNKHYIRYKYEILGA
mgnify:CR=1 FL=1